MYSVKEETDKNNICYGCLSTDRQLLLLKDNVPLFYNLLDGQPIYDPKIVLCWECRTLLNKIQIFQNRIQQAQYVLQQSFCALNTYEKLSTLCTTTRDYYDFTLEYVDIENETKDFEKQSEIIDIGIEKVVTNIVIENHNESNNHKKSNNRHEGSKRLRKKLDKNYEDTECSSGDEKYNVSLDKRRKKLKKEKARDKDKNPNIDDDYFEKDNKSLADYVPELNIKKESDDDYYSDQKDDNYSTEDKEFENPDKNDKNYAEKEEKRILHLKKYFDNVKVTDSDIDIENLRKYCTRVILNEKEIDEVLDREANTPRHGLRKQRPYECNECDKAYRREIDYKRHLTFNHMNLQRTGRMHCKYCKKSLKTWALLEKHWERHNYHFKCTLCGWLTRAYSVVMSHIESCHSKIYTCLKCNKQLSTMREFKRHFKETHERMVCDDCGKSFIRKRSLETHIRRHHLPPTCPICTRTYATYHNLENHYRLNHPELVRGVADKDELAYCVECNKQFPSVYKYRRHLSNAAIHTPPKIESVPCPECGKVFSRKIRMTNHVMSVHRKNTKHRCDICNKTFCSAYSAKTHRQCVHEKIPLPKNKFCDICGRGFSTNRILANHRRTHTGERPYACPHCAATFAQRTAMHTHARTQHKNLTNLLSEH